MCDASEVCDGVSPVCPDDQFLSSSSVCGNFLCTGTSPDCPGVCSQESDCANGATCFQSQCAQLRLAFTTSSVHNGNLGGLSGAHAICQNLATNAGLPGTYKAWLATDTVSVSSSLSHSTVPYYLPNGVKLADNWDDLLDGTTAVDFNITEASVYVPPNIPWTGTHYDGTTVIGANCNGWTTSAANVVGADGNSMAGGWSEHGTGSCGVLHRLFCFQQ